MQKISTKLNLASIKRNYLCWLHKYRGV
jgi:hypothetical protein